MNNNLMSFGDMSDDELEIYQKQLLNAQLERFKEKIQSIEISLGQHNQRMENIEHKVDKRMTIDYGQQQCIKNAKDRCVRQLWNEDSINKDVVDAIKKLHGKAWTDLKNAFGVSSYRDIREKDFDEAMNYIKAWRPRMF